ALKPSAGSYGNADIFYNGDVASWLTFAHSLKLRLAITLADVDAGYAKPLFEASASHAFSSNAQNITLEYGSEPLANTNPLYQALVASGRLDFIPANTIVDYMNTLNDPRRTAYFELNPDANGEDYVGGIYGASNAFGNYSHVGAVMHDPTFPIALMSYMEIEFYKAEAAARGWSTGGSAVEHYENAITASFAEWGIDGAADYIETDGVAWDGSGDWKHVIGMQAYIGYYQRGFEGWTTYRRLDWPEMNTAPAANTTDGKVLRRYTYPVNEQTLNADNYYSAASAIGGDFMETKLFWDKN
ncbi:MAG: SusD/RagB family nutrient-binding outer membrane lipoprotein, partial [Bacteroidales bacterium]|nr:SusD/RagB family nutrient-binding outer membrane lipoprotein [Bacteroidales bacterium]